MASSLQRFPDQTQQAFKKQLNACNIEGY